MPQGTLQLGGLRRVACAKPSRGTSSDCHRFQAQWSTATRCSSFSATRRVGQMTRRGTHSSIRSGTIFSLCWFLALSLLRSARLVRAQRGSVARRQLRGSRLFPSSSGGCRATKRKCEPSHVLLPAMERKHEYAPYDCCWVFGARR